MERTNNLTNLLTEDGSALLRGNMTGSFIIPFFSKTDILFKYRKDASGDHGFDGMRITQIDILEENEFEGYEDAIEEYKVCFEVLEKLEQDNADIKEVKEILDYINYKVDIKTGLVVNLQLYDNIKSVGTTLIKEYEEQGMLDELERTMGLKKNQILELFNNIDKNEFMLKKIGVLLNSKLIL